MALGVTALSGEARAFCRSTTGCGNDSAALGDNCYGAVDVCSSQPLGWQEGCVGFSVDEQGSARLHLSAKETIAAVQAAFDQWLGPVCDGEPPGLQVQFLAETDCSTFEYNEQGTGYGNSSTIFYVDHGALPKCAMSSGSSDTIAETCVTYDNKTGQIYDADMAIDSHTKPLKLAACPARERPSPCEDLNSVLLHEVGHFLGLAHVSDMNDIMFWEYTGQLTLSDDDKRGICAIYPPHRPTTGVCSFLPRHGFSAVCASSQQQLRCAAAPGSVSDSGSGASALVLFGLGLCLGWGRRALALARPAVR